MKKKTKIILSILICICVAGLSTAGILLFKNRTPKDDVPVKDVIVSASNGEETGASSATVKEKGGAMYIGGGETVAMHGGEISGQYNTYGGAIYVANGGTFNMFGGKITDCEAIYGGAIYVEAGGTCNLYGGEISGNRSSSSAIFLEDGSSFKISNLVTIKDNTLVSKYKINFFVDGLLIDSITSLDSTYELLETDFPLTLDNCCGYFFDENYQTTVKSNLISFSDKTMASNRKVNIYTKTATPDEFTFMGTGTSYACYLSSSDSYEEVVVPQQYNGLDVVSITQGSESSVVTSVVLPASLVNIREEAFSESETLKNVNIPDGVAEIGKKAFYNCGALEGPISIPGKVKVVGEKAFENCASLTGVVLQSGITEIKSSAFKNCDSLLQVEIPATVLNMGDSVFAECANLEKVNIHKGLDYLSAKTFYKCPKLTEVTIPASIQTIGDNAFMDCKALRQIVLPNTLTNIYSKAFAGCTSLRTLVIPISVFSISTEIVSGCTNLTTIFCEALSKPDFWREEWKENCDAEVVWGYLATNIIKIYVDGEYVEAQNVAGSYYTLEEGNMPLDFESCCGYFLNPELTQNIVDNTIYLEGDAVSIYTRTVTNLSNIVFEKDESAGVYKLSAQYVNMSGEVVLPKEYNDYQTVIKESGFSGCTKITKVVLPSGLNTIAQSAFAGCELLESVNISDSITVINDSAFYGSGLKSITFTDALEEIGANAFQNCTNIKNLNIPINVSSIGLNAFANIPTLRTIRVHEENEYFNSTNFCNALIETSTKKLLKGCDGTSFVLIEGEVNIIGESAFEGCAGLKNITIPNSVTTIEKNAFKNCTNVTKIIFGTGLVNIGEYAFADLHNLNYLTLPSSVRTVGIDAFAYCWNLVGITIESGLTYIPDYCFAFCYDLNHVVLPTSITSIGKRAFSSCDNLTSIYLPSSITTISVSSYEEAPFRYCDSGLKIYCGASSKPAGYGDSWDNYSSSGKLTVIYGYTNEQYLEECGPSNINIYVDGVFTSKISTYGTYYDLIEEELPLSYEECCGYFLDEDLTIGTNGTVSMTERNVNIYTKTANNLSSLVFFEMYQDPTERLYVSASGYISGELVIPKEYNNRTVYLIDEAFYGCDAITSVIIPEGTDNIVYGAFMRCSSLQKVNMQESYKIINSSAFYHCGSLEDFEFPSSLEIIGDNVFTNCFSLTSVTIPASVTQIGVQAFEGCSGISSFTVEAANTVYNTADENALIHTATNALMFGSQVTDLTSIENLDRIENYAFAGQTEITSIIIPASVTYVGWASFQNCSSLTQIVVEAGNTVYDSRNGCNAVIETQTGKLIVGCNGTVFEALTDVTSIEISAFQGCSGLTRVVIPESVTKIGVAAFAKCLNLVSVVISNSVTTLEQNVFWKCTKLETVYIPASVAVIKDIMTGYSTFNGCSSLTLYVEVESKQEGWQEYWNYYDTGKKIKVNYGVTLEEFLLENPSAMPQ